MGRPRGHPRGLGLARTWEATPYVRASLTIGFGLAVTASSDPDSGSFRPGRCGPARVLVAFSDLGVAESVQTHVGGVGVGLVVAACSDPGSGSVVQYERWRRGLAWLWWCGFGQGRSQHGPDPVFQQHFSFLSFFVLR
jgi:hypothetical protein